MVIKQASELIKYDYINEFISIYRCLDCIIEGMGPRAIVKPKTFREEYITSDKWKGKWDEIVFTDEDLDTIKKLDELVAESNSVLSEEPIEYVKLVRLMIEACKLIRYPSEKLDKFSDYFR